MLYLQWPTMCYSNLLTCCLEHWQYLVCPWFCQLVFNMVNLLLSFMTFPLKHVWSCRKHSLSYQLHLSHRPGLPSSEEGMSSKWNEMQLLKIMFLFAFIPYSWRFFPSSRNLLLYGREYFFLYFPSVKFSCKCGILLSYSCYEFADYALEDICMQL